MRYGRRMPNAISEINDCRFLFLADIQELGRNSLKLVVTEGLPVGEPGLIEVGGVTIPDCVRIDTVEKSRMFELIWDFYIAYSVLNESFTSMSDEEKFEGLRFRIYSNSYFIDYLSRASFACDEHPGPTRHYCVACEDHIVNVLSVNPPAVRRLESALACI